MNKYHARRTKDGASGRERTRAKELELMERAGMIKDLRKQVKFLLIPSQYEGTGKKRRCVERSVSYIADFVYTDNGITIVEDSKGYRTKDYIIKRKLMLYIHGIRIKET